MTLIEVMASLSILAVTSLAVMAGMVVASNANGMSRRRTIMLQFAQSRLEVLGSRTRTKIPTAATTTPFDCSKMAVSGTFDPNAAPGTGGWMLDVIDGTPPAGGGTQGDDLMFGPLLAEGDFSGIDPVVALSARSSFSSAWFGNTDTLGCGSPTVTKDLRLFCREIHIQPFDFTSGGVSVSMLRVWVRVVHGGEPWQNSYVMLQQDLAQ
jgi:type II secretory pathway pseudopilin PulG